MLAMDDNYKHATRKESTNVGTNLNPNQPLQTSRKSTSGFRRAHTDELKRPTTRRTSDSSLLVPQQQQPAAAAASQQSSLGLKLVFKRQSGDKYEISSPLHDLPSSESHRKVKFPFESDENEDDDGVAPKRIKTTRDSEENEPIPFESSDLVEKDDALVSYILAHQPRVRITHSIPFPIALVEDKTNIVHTKALLLIHLYKSYASPCIICVLCKHFFSINEFSKHFHISDDELDEDDDDEDEVEEDKRTNKLVASKGSSLDLQMKRERKLAELRKNSYKILPYFLNKNNELNEDQLKIWKMFGERFAKFKLMHQQSVSLKTKAGSLNESATLKSSSTIKKKPSHEINKEKDKENKVDMFNWDFIDATKKSFLIKRERLDNEQIVYLSKDGDQNIGEPSLTETSATTTTLTTTTTTTKTYSSTLTNDLYLSEEEDEDESSDKKKAIRSPNEENKKKGGEKVVESEQPAASPRLPVCHVSDVKSYFYSKMPSPIEKCFNYYDNLSNDILRYIQYSPHLVTPQSLILYNIKQRLRRLRNLLVSTNPSFKLKWLCLTLDLHVTSKQRNL